MKFNPESLNGLNHLLHPAIEPITIILDELEAVYIPNARDLVLLPLLANLWQAKQQRSVNSAAAVNQPEDQ